MGEVDSNLQLKVGEVLESRWKVVRKLGEGSFGAVYEAQDVKNEYKERMALKLESRQCPEQVLKIEVAIMASLKGSQHVAHMYSGGSNARFNFLLMGMLGPSLNVLRDKVKHNKFSMSTTTRLIYQCIQAVKVVHQGGWLHRDVKPANFAIGSSQQTKDMVYIFDFGLARAYTMTDGSVRPARSVVGFRGTVRYSSINGLKNLELGRHDDLISLVYMFVEMVKGELPWSYMSQDDDVLKCKQLMTQTLYKDMPALFVPLHNYLHSLTYGQTPIYSHFENILLEAIHAMKYSNQPFDWEQSKIRSIFSKPWYLSPEISASTRL